MNAVVFSGGGSLGPAAYGGESEGAPLKNIKAGYKPVSGDNFSPL